MKEIIALLKLDFEEKKKKNPLYSLRSLAKQLEIQPGTISHVFNGKREISKGLRFKIYDYLGLEEEIILSLEKKASEKTVKFVDLETSYLETLSDWHYDAILELMRNKDFVQDVKFIARRLNISVAAAEEAVEKLFGIGRLTLSKEGQWIDTLGNTLVYGNLDTTDALRGLQKKIAMKSVESITSIPKSQREHASMCMAVSKQDLPWVRAKIKKFQQELCEQLQKREQNSDEVYQLMTSFFPLTELGEEEVYSENA